MTWFLVVIEGPDRGRKAFLASGSAIIGRDQDRCSLVLTAEEVSRIHALITVDLNGTVNLEDLGSTQGTFVNGERIDKSVPLRREDVIQLGNSRLQLVWLEGATGIQEHTLPANSIYIGRDPSNDLVINDPKVSRSHARLDLQAGITCLTDLESAHGTYLNGQPVRGTVEIRPSSRVQICGYNFIFDGLDLRGEDGAVAATLRSAAAGIGHPLAHTLQLPFNRGSIFKLLFGVLLSLIPVANFLTDGYRYRLFQGGVQGNMEMPEWKDWQDLFVRGLLFYLVQLVYFLPALLILLFSLLFAGWQTGGSGDRVMTAGLTLGLFLLLLAALLLPMGWAHFAATGRFGSAFEFNIIISLIKTVTTRYAALLLLLVAMWLVLGVIALVPVLGIFVAIIGAFYIKVVFALLLGELYRSSLSLKKGH